MADKLPSAFKDAIQEELQTFLAEQGKNTERCEELSKAVQDLSGKIVEREQESEKLRAALEKFQQDLEAANEKTQSGLTDECTVIKGRLDKFEDDADGIGGLKQIHERLSNLERTMGETQPKLDENIRLVKDNTTRTDEFDRKMRELAKQLEDMMEALKASDERVTKIEGVSATVSVAQEALEDSVTRKYEVLWADVLNAIKEAQGGQLDVVQKELAEKNEAARIETRSLVNYALNFMASAHGERRQMAVNRGLMQAWKEQTWISARRRLGISYLHKIAQRRQRSAYDLWHRRHSTSVLCDRLHGQYTGQLKDVYKAMEEGETDLKGRCGKLDVEVHHLQEKKATKHSLDHAIEQLRSTMQEELKALDPINATLKEHGVVQIRHDELHRGHTDAEATLDAKVSGLGRDLADVVEAGTHYAKADEVKGMIRDVLLIWNSIKQIDAAKADKKDVDSFALETGNRDKLSQRRLEDFESDLASKARQESMRTQEKWGEVEGRLDESGRQFRHWEQMWEKLSGFVEDLVTKIGDLQQGGDHKLQTSTLRMPGPGRPPSREGSVSRSRAKLNTASEFSAATAEIPRLPSGQGGHDSTTATTPSHDAKMLWLSSAKGIVDATLDQAIHSASSISARPRSRPTSAKAPSRRPHERAR
jgi:DNA repair exonuclease SbcCD ATPase subunit